MTGDERGSEEVTGFAEALDHAVNADGRTLESLQRHLADRGFEVSVATLSYWRSGRSLPARAASLQAIPHLEEILSLPAGHLSSRLPPTTRRGRQRPEAAVPEDISGVLHDVLGELGMGLDQELVDLSVHVTVDVDATGSVRRYSLRNVVRAAVDGAQRVPAIVTDSDRDGGPRLFTGPGAHLGRVARNTTAGVYAAEVVLDRPLAKDAVAVVEHGEEFAPGDYTDAFMTYVAMRRLREVAVWVRFADDHLPTELVAHHDLPVGEVALHTELIGSTGVLVLHDFGPGAMGLRWSW